MQDEESRSEPKGAVVLGEDLERHSRIELEARIAALEAEITRCREEIARKGAQRDAADKLFSR